MKKRLAFIMAWLVFCMPALHGAGAETVRLRIIATSDLHGKFAPWDYALNEESLSGSAAQLAGAIAAYRTPNTLLVDAGDTIQDNSAEIFLDSGDTHPMVQALNFLDYDVWVTGNHEVFTFAVNNYCAASQLLVPGIICEADDMPVLLEKDVRGDIGGIRELIRDYIVNVKGGAITPECSENWRIVGIE